MLPDVPFDGWTRPALRAAARHIGMPADEALALFPRGAAELVACFSHWADSRCWSGSKPGPRAGESPSASRSRHHCGCRGPAPWREAVRRGLSVLALPQNAPLGWRLLYDTVDGIWHGVGDRATDFSFYTKRATLAAIQAATTLYWLDDRSPGFADTQAFIDRRLAGVVSIGKSRQRFETVLARLPNPLRLLRQFG